MLLRCESLEPPMSQLGLGGVKTRAAAARVEYLGGIARRESSNHAAAERRNAGLENCIFYISPMYEFSHRVGQNAKNSHSAYLGRSTPVWTAPSWQGHSSPMQIGRCAHVFGLLRGSHDRWP